MVTRRTSGQLVIEAADAALAALRAAGLTSSQATEPEPGDVIRVTVDDRTFPIRVVPKPYCTAEAARQLLAAKWSDGSEVAPLVVSEKVTVDARSELSRAGYSWLDRRGHLYLRGPGVMVDVDVPSEPGRTTPSGRGAPISGRSGLTVAYWQLSQPDEALSPNRMAARLGLAPSTISVTTRRLAEAGLVDEGHRAVIPELFWELAEAWPTERTWLAGTPQPPLDNDPQAAGWRIRGDSAAAAWGAPVVSQASDTLELYVPGPVEVTVARRRYGVTEAGTGRANLAVAPVARICAGLEPESRTPRVGNWAVAPKLAVALDLAQDRGRGREILAGWRDDDAVWI